MIVKMIHGKEKKEHVYLLFGTGTIEVMTGGPEEVNYEDNPTDVIFSMVDKPHEIGAVTGNDYNCTTELNYPIIMRFSKLESVEVVLDALNKVRASFANKRKAHMNVGEILEKYLKDNGYDGLYADECGCQLSDLKPCECQNTLSCQPGYSVKASEADPEGHDFYILSTKEDVAEHEKKLEDG